MPDTSTLNETRTGSRWPGVLLSLFVPGFGLVRAGHILRGVAWFVALYVLAFIVGLATVSRIVPFWGVVASLIILVGSQIAMLADSFRGGRLNVTMSVVFALAFIVLLLAPSPVRLIAGAFKNPSGGMDPTLLPGDHLIADRLTYMWAPPRRGDLVIFRTAGIPGIPADTLFVQRLVGLPGETIEIQPPLIQVDGRRLGPNDGIPAVKYITGPHQSFMVEPGVYRVPPDAYFMLGDNSRNSFDSRYWGFLPQVNVDARVARIYYPFSRVGDPK